MDKSHVCGPIDDFEQRAKAKEFCEPKCKENRYWQYKVGGSAIGIGNSRNNVVANNYFHTLTDINSIYLTESDSTAEYMHGVYMAWYAHWNIIFNNVFKNVSGSPVRVRDFSNFNVIQNNLFSRSGTSAFEDWFCNYKKTPKCAKIPGGDPIWPEYRECPSYENNFTDNIIDGGYHPTVWCAGVERDEIMPLDDMGYLEICCDSPYNQWSPLPCDSPGQEIPGIPEYPWVRAKFLNNDTPETLCLCYHHAETVDDCRQLIEEEQ